MTTVSEALERLFKDLQEKEKPTNVEKIIAGYAQHEALRFKQEVFNKVFEESGHDISRFSFSKMLDLYISLFIANFLREFKERDVRDVINDVSHTVELIGKPKNVRFISDRIFNENEKEDFIKFYTEIFGEEKWNYLLPSIF